MYRTMSKLYLLAAIFLLLGGMAIAQTTKGTTLYFPHFATGGGWNLSMAAINTGSSVISVNVSFFDQAGDPKVLQFTTGPASSFDVSLMPHASLSIATNDAGSELKTGYAIVESDSEDVTGTLIYRYSNGTEVSVPPSQPGRKFMMPVEISSKLDCGIAVAFESFSRPLELKLYDSNGILKSESTWLLSGNQEAKFISQLVTGLGSFQGFLEITAEADFSILGLRYWYDTSALSAIPVFDPRITLDPDVKITFPTSGRAFNTDKSSLSLSGNAFSRAGVSSFSWANDRGGFGSIIYGSSWTASGITLQPGLNNISVTINDARRRTRSDYLAVIFTAPTITWVSASCSPATIQSGGTSQCTATVNGTGSYSSAVTWSATAGTISATGLFTAPSVTSVTSVTIAAKSVQDNTKSGTATVTVNPPTSTITVVADSCSPATIQSGGTSQCTATVTGTGSYSSAVIWSATAGTVSASGLFTAPAVSSSTTVTIRATSVQDASKSGSTTVIVNPPGSTITSVTASCSPTTIQSSATSQCTASVAGTGNYSSAVTWSVVSGGISTSGLYTAPYVLVTEAVTIKATSVQDPTKSGSATVIVNPFPPTITSVTSSCSPATITSGTTSQCTAIIIGTGNYSTAITWSATAGTISLSGLFTAPIVTSATAITIRATSVQDPTKIGSTTVTVNPASPTITRVTVNCFPSTIVSGGTSSCTASVEGSGNFSSAVTWSATAGTISSTGLFTAPFVATTTNITLTATSVQDNTKSGSAAVAVNPPASTITRVTASCPKNSLETGQTDQCTAIVEGTGSFLSAVTWTVSTGAISTTGLYTAPVVTAWTTVTITATSVQDTTKTGTATVTVTTYHSCASGGTTPKITINSSALGAYIVSGTACNIDTATIKVVGFALTNQWYVQPYITSPWTNISSDGTWTVYTHPWDVFVAVLADPAKYSPPSTSITNPALDPNVLAWDMYPPGQATVSFSGYSWGIKSTGSQPTYRFDPGPNFWSSNPSVVSVQGDGLHLKITQLDGNWVCSEVFLQNSLGYGTYTMKVASRLDNLDTNIVAAPMFIYASTSAELDNEYSGMGGLIPSPNNAQFVVQPYFVSGNIVRYLQPTTSQFTTQIEWRADHVTFTSWNGWSDSPLAGDIIYQWTYTGPYIPAVGSERVRINLWLLNGAAPTNGVGDEMVISSFSFNP